MATRRCLGNLLLAAAAAAVASGTIAEAEACAAEACDAETLAMDTSLLQTSATTHRLHGGRLRDEVAASSLRVIQPGSNAPGPFAVESQRAFVGGYEGCGWSEYAEVWFPVAAAEGFEPGPVPLLSFSHGFMMGMENVSLAHGTIVPFLVSWGFVVIAHESEDHEYIWRHPMRPGHAPSFREERSDRRQLPFVIPPPVAPVYCANATYDQIRSLEWARSSDFAGRIDWDSPTGVAGFSQGAAATVRTAMDASAVAAHNIGAAFAWMPYGILRFGGRRPLVPIFLAAGEMDDLSHAAEIQEFYNQIESDAPRVHAMVDGLGHNNALRHEPFHVFAVAMFQCHLLSLSDACALLYGDSPGALCSRPELSVCEHANQPEH